MFYDTENEEHYQERWMQCNWNQTWTLTDQLDDCVWVQCLYPPDPPPEAQTLDPDTVIQLVSQSPESVSS